MRRFVVIGVVALCAAFVSAPSFAQDATPGEHLGGYVGQASAMALSFQPVFPALLPTGDAPIEATFALSTADLKSGGNAYGHASLLWPGSAAADPGPLFAQAAGRPQIAGMFPKWAIQAQARQGQGVVTTGAPPAIVMRATGYPDQAAGDSRVADIDIPGLAHVEHVASTASSVVTDTLLTSESRVALHGVSLLNGYITADEISSVSKTTSDSSHATTTGKTAVHGLLVGGASVTVTDGGFRVDNGPPGSESAPGSGKRFPGQSPAQYVQQVLDSLHARLTLFRSAGRAGGGAANSYATGFVLSVDNPAGGVGPVPPGHFDLIMSSTSASTLASPPFELTLPSLPSAPASATEPASVSIGSGPSVSAQTITNGGTPPVAIGGTPGAQPATGTLNAVTQRSRYEFGGVPIGLAIGLLVLALIAARYVRRALLVVMAPKE